MKREIIGKGIAGKNIENKSKRVSIDLVGADFS
jgi:hypothetical protein